ncbi:MAG TPA: helix-turn-helix transcriptional regulator [Candidatus Acidoferrales bacterium]
MVIGDRLKALREAKDFSQGEIEKRTGLLRCYISRVENGHTVPAIETLEKLARAMEVPMYQLFYDGEQPPKITIKMKESASFGRSPKEARVLDKFRRLLSRTSTADKKLLIAMATKMAGR